MHGKYPELVDRHQHGLRYSVVCSSEWCRCLLVEPGVILALERNKLGRFVELAQQALEGRGLRVTREHLDYQQEMLGWEGMKARMLRQSFVNKYQEYR